MVNDLHLGGTSCVAIDIGQAFHTVLVEFPDGAHQRFRMANSAKDYYTEEDGWCWFFGAIDHCVDELVGWHTAKIGDRWAALEPLRQGVRHVFGRFAKDVARGLRIRCDWGPQYIADAWINEVKWLGITRPRTSESPSAMASSSASCARSRSSASISIASRVSPRRTGSSVSSSRATTPSGSSSGSAIRRRWPRESRRWRHD